MKKRLLTILAIIQTIALSSCGVPSLSGYDDRFTLDEYKLVDFSNGYPHGYGLRNDRGNGHPFNCSFSKDNVDISDGEMTFSLTKSGDRYVGAELFSYQSFGYGFYSVYMKAAKCPGVISSFFTYVGNPWHEIDIEFLGNDTTKIQFNHYTDGVGHHEYVYNLGFDASLEYHEYAFLWEEDSIVYYVDGKAVHKTTDKIPSTPGRIMMNLWNVHDSNKEWAGKFDDSKLPVTSSYKWFGYQGV